MLSKDCFSLVQCFQLHHYVQIFCNPPKMIQINESRNYMQEKSCPAYLGKPLFDINKNIFKFPTKKPKYKFYPQRTLPIHGNDCLSTCEAKNGVFLASYNNTDFRYIDDEIIRFKINNKAHTVKMLGKQVFLASKTHLYSYHDHTYQSLSLNSICMDTMELTNEVVFLQNDRIRFLHGEEYELSCNDPKGIYFTDHPRNVILTTTKCIYHIDLRTEKPNFVMNSGGDITKLIKTKNNYIVQFNTGFTVFDKYFGHNEYTSMYLSNSFQVMSNDNEIIAHSATVFKYFDINNLSVNSIIQHDIADFIGFATQNDRHYFFRDHCIDEFDSKGKIRSIGCQFKDTQGKQKTTIFFDNDFCQNRRCEEYRIVDDYNIDKYDEFMDLVKNENDEQSIPKIEKIVQKKRVKRAAGF